MPKTEGLVRALGVLEQKLSSVEDGYVTEERGLLLGVTAIWSITAALLQHPCIGWTFFNELITL